MHAVDLIRRKRDGGALDRDQIEQFVRGVTDGTLPDYQASALLMAILLRGMTADETAWLTDAMVRSGVRVEYPDVDGTPVDKHSTGGVGDKTSLILAPLAVACGAVVPMMSGRGLGHTGGTLDKLESIPGFRTDLSLDELRAAIGSIGCALIGQTAEIAPADRRLYALRDVTGTVESIPLISASIMSKKIAEGIGGLVLDVKIGARRVHEDARRRPGARAVARRRSAKRPASAPRRSSRGWTRRSAAHVGNALEVIECLEMLKGDGPDDLVTLSIAAGGADAAPRRRRARRGGGRPPRARGAGAAAPASKSSAEIVENQGGDPRVVDDYARLPVGARRGPCAPRPTTGTCAPRVRERSAARPSALGAGRATARRRRSITASASRSWPRPARRVKRGEAVLLARHRNGRGPRARPAAPAPAPSPSATSRRRDRGAILVRARRIDA